MLYDAFLEFYLFHTMSCIKIMIGSNSHWYVL